jgi:hypothetical protein
MKRIFLFLVASLTMYSLTSGQAREVTLQMSMGNQSGITIAIPEAESRDIEKIWKKYTKDYGKLIKVKKTDELVIQNASIPSILPNMPLDMYSVIEDYGITVFIDLKPGFINSTDHPDAFNNAKSFMQNFANEVQRELITAELEKEQDELKKLNRKINDLVKDNKSYHKDIEDARERIKKAEANIINNEKDQELTKAQIITQSKTVANIQGKLNNIGK